MSTEGPGVARVSTGAAIVHHLVEAGYDAVDLPLLHEAKTFIEFGGEDIRTHLYLTADATGAELCLRPELTIPAVRAYLASPAAGRPAAKCYHGPVFRMSSEGSGERVQVGIENFGRLDTAAADAEVLALSLEAVERSGTRLTSVSVGDAGLVAAMLEAVELPLVFQRRIRHALERGQGFDVALRGAPARRPEHSGLLAALAGADRQDARALIADLLSISGITAVGGRSISEITDRYLTQVAQGATLDVGDERREVLESFFAVTGDIDRASGQLRALADDAKLDLTSALDLLDQRTGFIAAQGIDLGHIDFRTAFNLNIDYYTGFVFEAYGGSWGGPVISGGRYDRLCGALGSAEPIPAVGAAIWLDRLDTETDA